MGDMHFKVSDLEKDDSGTAVVVGDDGGGEDDEEQEAISARRRKSVDSAIRRQKNEGSGLGQGKVMSVAEGWQGVVKVFFGGLLRPSACRSPPVN